MDKNDSDEVYSFLLEQLEHGFYPVKNKESLFKDKYQTKQQSIRDRLISNLLKAYVDRFNKKSEETLKDRKVLKAISIIAIVTIIMTIITIVVYSIFEKDISSTESLTAVIASLVTLSGSLFGIINYIAKRAFPEDDEKYITEIVKLIQENDLKHKQENIKAAAKLIEQQQEEENFEITK